MRLIGVILLILGLTKISIAFSSEKSELVNDLKEALNSNPEEFLNKLITILVIDGLIGILTALFLI